MAPETLTLIFTGIVTVSTVVYALLTWKLTDETRLLRRAQTEPSLSVHIESGRWVNAINLVIANHGNGIARDITWTVEPSPEALRKFDVEIASLRLLDGLSQLASGQRIESFFGMAFKMVGDPGCPPITVRARHRDVQGKNHETSFVLAPKQFEGLLRVGDPVEEEVSKSLKSIAKLLDNVVSGGKLHIGTSPDSRRTRLTIGMEEEIEEELPPQAPNAETLDAEATHDGAAVGAEGAVARVA